MQLFSMLAVLAAISVAQVAPDRPVDHARPRLAVMVAGMLILAAWAALVSRRAVWQIRLARGARRYCFRKWETLQAALCFLFAVTVLYGLGWPQLVRANWGLNRWPLVDDALILVPAMLPLFVSWLLFFDVDQALRWTASSGDRNMGRWQYALLHVRCHWLLILLPVVGLVVVHDLLGWFIPAIVDSPQEWCACVAYLVMLVVFFPGVLKWAWRSESLAAEPLRRHLEAATRRWNVEVKDFLIWRTGSRVVNAAVTGVVPSCRYVFLSDGLLRKMTPAEIEAVCAHELGHVGHHHVGLRMMAAMGPPLLVFAGARRLVDAALIGHLSIPGDPAVLTGWCFLAGVALYGVAFFGPYARLLEQQADWYACLKLAEDGRARADAGALEAATARFSRTLALLGQLSGQASGRGAWLHPSPARRIAFVRRLCRSPRRARRFHDQMRWLAWGMTLATAAGGILLGAAG